MKTLVRVLDAFDGTLERYFAKKWHWAITVPAVILFYFAAYFVFCFSGAVYTNDGYRNDGCRFWAGFFFGFAIALSTLYLILEGITGRISSRKTMWAFMVIGSSALTLWGFAAAVNLGPFHHDAGALHAGNHWSIIYDIFRTGNVPAAVKNNQYYQPKLYHWVIANLAKFNGLFVHLGNEPVSAEKAYAAYTLSAYHQFEMTRIFMILLGIAGFYAVYRILKGLGLQGKKVGLAFALTVMIPEFWYIQFFLNNDGMALTLSLIAFALALEFKRTEKTIPLLASAVALGLAMMAKLNSALMAIPMAVTFLFVLIKKFKERKENEKALWHLVGQFGLFALIVFPLGLWTPIYYQKAYGIPFGYVLDLTPTQESKEAYGMFIDPSFYNFFERCILFPARDLFVNVYNVRWRTKVGNVYVNKVDTIDFNCWTALFKTMMFDEWNNFNSTSGAFGNALLCGYLYIEVFLAMFGIVGVVYYVFRFFKKKLYRGEAFVPAVLGIGGLTFAINYIYFVNRYPVGCSMNARYVMPLVMIIEIVIASSIVDGIALSKKARALSAQ